MSTIELIKLAIRSLVLAVLLYLEIHSFINVSKKAYKHSKEYEWTFVESFVYILDRDCLETWVVSLTIGLLFLASIFITIWAFVG